MNTELDRSLDRLWRSEDHRGHTTGFGTTKQGQALARKYREQLADSIRADRTNRCRDRTAWQAIKGIGDAALAIRLLVAGVSVAAEASDLGTDADGEKNFRDIALWMGRNTRPSINKREINLKVGAWGINMLLSLPVFRLDGDVLKMTAAAYDLMDGVLARAIAKHPLLSPLTTPPVPWTQVRKGGLPADHWAKVPLIREHHPSIENAVCNAISRGRMQPVLRAINVLQRATFTINEHLLDFILRAEKPSGPDAPQPPIWQQQNRQQWTEALAKLDAFDIDMVTAEAIADKEHFWVPLNIDFRGRIYGIPHFNFQREDRIRSLFLFADGEPIGEEGLKWLKAHVAGAAGGKPRKLGHYDRIKWTDANLEKLCDVGRAVLRRDDPATIAWPLPKDRYQFLAACVELAQATDEGPTFKTRLPLMFDGSCSGLQHLCAMTRDEVGGQYVNLTDAFEPDDFYSRVAQRVWDDAPDLRHLMQGPDDREIVKQPAMSYFYGSRPGGFAKSKDGRWRPYGMTRQIIDVLKDRRKNSTEGAKEFAHAIYRAIEAMLPRAKAVRNFLRRLAWLYAKEGKPLRWTTPLGLPVINCYYQPEIERIPVWLNGRCRTVKLVTGDTKDIRKTKAANSAAANFIHSMDATHLQAVAIEAAKAGIEIVTVHDCFGCLAPRARRLKEIIGLQFVYLHRCNLLAEILESAQTTLPKNTKLPPLPETGSLKLENVLLNEHAFKN